MSIVVENAFFADLLVGEVGSGFTEGAQADGFFYDAILRCSHQWDFSENRIVGMLAGSAKRFRFGDGAEEASAHSEAKAQAGEAQEFPALKVTRHLVFA